MKKNMSIKFRLCFWAITAPIVPFIIILVLLVMINPFWFRMDFANWVEGLVNKFSAWRFEKLKPLYYKDNFFEILKDPDSLS